jgi:hypothetical protein
MLVQLHFVPPVYYKNKTKSHDNNSYGIHTILIEDNRCRIVKRIISQMLGHHDM